MSHKLQAQIAIVGRPNVGKSAIFNCIAKRRIAIVHNEPGVTRDRVATDCQRPEGISYELTDTGGIGALLDDGFANQVRAEADIAIESADLILFVVDAREGVHPIDRELANILRSGGAPVIILANKVDTDITNLDAAEFSVLGFKNQVNTSAAHGRNFGQLEELIQTSLSELGLKNLQTDGAEIPPVKIAIVGRPNVGKSSLINGILEDDRSIVSNVAGTTRDAIDVPYQRDAKDYTLIDTAGIRKRNSRDTSVEVFSVMRSEKSIRRADLCLLVIDASSGVVSQDRRIARMVIDAKRPCIVILNKFDLYHPDADFQDRIDQFREELGDDLFFLPYAPKVAVSAKNKEFLGKIFHEIENVVEAASKPITTSVLNQLLQRSIERNPPPVRHSKRLKLLYATQKRSDIPQAVPVPEYLLFVNYAKLLTRTYERFLENQIRKEHPMEGLPFIFRARSRISKDKGGSSSRGRKMSESEGTEESSPAKSPKAKGKGKPSDRPRGSSKRGSTKHKGPGRGRGR